MSGLPSILGQFPQDAAFVSHAVIAAASAPHAPIDAACLASSAADGPVTL
jgi:hypothetical protein